jgi:hypothetical protein
MHPHLRKSMIKFDKSRADYDSRFPDHSLGDWFELPPDTASALLVVRFRPIGDNLNDTLAIGDLSGWRHTASTRAADPDPRLGWKRSGDLHWVELADLPMRSGGTVLDLVTAPHASGIIDIQVVDDSSVDFMAIAYCRLPSRRMGVTMATVQSPKGLASFHCRPDIEDDRDCNPFVGDEPCGNALPLLCFHDLQAPAPVDAVRFSALTRRSWSGGEVAATSPVRASRFATISNADRFCSTSFGKGWRVAEWHAGGWGYGFAAKTNRSSFSGRYWVDIRGSPYGTCWSRDRAR